MFNVIGRMQFRPQPIVIAMEQFMPTGLEVEIDGKKYDLIQGQVYLIQEDGENRVVFSYNGGKYILRNPYPKELSDDIDEGKPEINYIKREHDKTVDYYILLNVRTIKLKVYATVTEPTPAPAISLYVADKVIDITQLDTWQDINVEFPKRIPMSIMYIDVKDKKNAPERYSIRGNIKDWEFTS